MADKKTIKPKKRSRDLFVHEVSNLATGLSFVSEELQAYKHNDRDVRELIDNLAILAKRLYQAVKEKISA
ncbi:MAG: hypothetical protein A3I29_04910 [Candidatus Magasanikbacteria bacterium RIFCSPLOWO2_02_FULL_44_11]|uniref:Uncharacterized protein n=2 Tax=Candidatus Magasanikiibacteriota TaxID=1752731 RepID=A0A1F6NA56_9BACT|nr:MAG: hypothetical protein A3D53_02350 [Candidatus Magasanikbacteria bacterium RIFCSPHIGHO2_02_FULL_45_10]OGH80796.1 MAG: hypothetical protein A3I29_04910 [Candidatus Magasanikbacteria bacterium RIFCSPLOWO2_02_FULL_44_11]